MELALRHRYTIIGSVMLLLFGILCFQLANLQIRQGQDYALISESGKTREIALKGRRGMILDTSGIPLAYDEMSYDVVFYRDRTKTKAADRERYTKTIIETIKIIEANGGKIQTTFNVRKNDEGVFDFYWGGDLTEDEKTSREARWRSNMGLTGQYKTADPYAIYWFLRHERYKLPDDMSYEEAIKVLSIWQEVQLTGYIAYLPVTVAKNVTLKTVAQIESNASVLEGMQISEGTTRVYPKQDTAAHVVGYLGRISPDNVELLTNRKYSLTDLAGISGIEATMEEALTGNSYDRQGSLTVEVNNLGMITREISRIEPKDGDNVMLSLDLGLQKVSEQALRKNIEMINQRQHELYLEDKDKYDRLVSERGYDIRYGNEGAVVVMDISTGKVLSLVSESSYDANMFTNGISQEDFEALDEGIGTPLFNKAISSKGTPGSIFKMIVGLAGLEEGVVTLDEVIDDAGEYDKYVSVGSGPKCWVRPNYNAHKDQNIVKALSNSCNYYFFTVADRLRVDRLNKWCDMIGLTSLTNIELTYEQRGQVGNQKVLYDHELSILNQATVKPRLVRDKVVSIIQDVGTDMGVYYDAAQLGSTVEKMMKYTVTYSKSTTEIERLLLDEIKIPAVIIRQNNLTATIASYLDEIKWNPNQTIRVGIGQSLTTVTPIAVARYISALLNGGIVYDAQIVKNVVDSKGNLVYEKEPNVVSRLNVNPEYLAAIKQGMRNVVSLEDGGTAGKEFADWKYTSDIGGKTGTAQVSTIDLEDNSWFVAFAPYDDPEIAVVVFIPQGIGGSNSSYTVKQIIQYYLDRKNNVALDNIADNNTLLP